MWSKGYRCFHLPAFFSGEMQFLAAMLPDRVLGSRTVERCNGQQTKQGRQTQRDEESDCCDG